MYLRDSAHRFLFPWFCKFVCFVVGVGVDSSYDTMIRWMKRTGLQGGRPRFDREAVGERGRGAAPDEQRDRGRSEGGQDGGLRQASPGQGGREDGREKGKLVVAGGVYPRSCLCFFVCCLFTYARCYFGYYYTALIIGEISSVAISECPGTKWDARAAPARTFSFINLLFFCLFIYFY